MGTKKIRVVIAKPGLDGHDRGAKVLCLALRDAGMEVVYTGLHKTPAQIAEIALEESADVLGLSVLSGAHVPLAEKVMAALRERGLGDVKVLVGGVIPEGDVKPLLDLGVAAVFPTGSDTDAIAARIREMVS